MNIPSVDSKLCVDKCIHDGKEYVFHTDEWTINGKKYSFQDRQDFYNELLLRGMIKEKPEKTIHD